MERSRASWGTQQDPVSGHTHIHIGLTLKVQMDIQLTHQISAKISILIHGWWESMLTATSFFHDVIRVCTAL